MNINRENARAVHTQILLKPDTHNQDIWIRNGSSAESCGTTACVAGWAAMLDPQNKVVPKLDIDNTLDYPGARNWFAAIIDRETGEEMSVSYAGERALGFDSDSGSQLAADWLFASERTRGEVLDQLAYMAYTGQFDWSMVGKDERYVD